MEVQLSFLEIKLKDIIFDPKVQTYCVNTNFKCPSYGHSWTCPPEAPYLEEEVSKYKKFYLIFVKLNLKKYIEKKKVNHPNRSDISIRNAFFMKNFLRDKLEQEVKLFIEKYNNNYEEKLILWDGFCRICFNKEDKGCTYDDGDPCRYPYKKRYSMEAVGIDVNQTVKNLNFNLEWPPNKYTYRFGLVCFK
jgi:predicted metal-binding protein